MMTSERFAQFCDRIVPDGACWRWTGKFQAGGYARMSIGGWKLAHRLSHEHFIGPIPDGFDIDHLCRHQWCVNPLHLEPVTPRENSRRSSVCKESPFFAPHSADRRARVAAALRGRTVTPETRAKLSANNARPMTGKTPSAETRAKLSASQRERWAKRKAA